MIESKGKNDFKNNVFSYWEWSAPVLQSPEELIDKYYEYKLEHRVIRDVIAVGLGYDWGPDMIGGLIVENSSTKREKRVRCFAEIDEPFLIVFEDGDVLAIHFAEGSSVRFDMNTLPITINPGTNPKNFHANRLFKEVIGKEIRGLDVVISTIEPDFTGSYGLVLGDQKSYITRFDILLGVYSKERISLSFSSYYDYGQVCLLDFFGHIKTLPFEEIPKIVDGFADPGELSYLFE